jgi:hypothetical protein
MKSKQWKVAELQVARLFGGRRTPLSGKNSGHETSSDVIGIPRWMYIEVKRRADYNPFVMKFYPILKKGFQIQLDYAGYKFALFRLDVFMVDQRLARWNALLKRSPFFDITVVVRGVRVIFTVYFRTYRQAMAENRDGVYLVLKLHNRQGYYCLCDMHSFNRLCAHNQAGEKSGVNKQMTIKARWKQHHLLPKLKPTKKREKPGKKMAYMWYKKSVRISKRKRFFEEINRIKAKLKEENSGNKKAKLKEENSGNKKEAGTN